MQSHEKLVRKSSTLSQEVMSYLDVRKDGHYLNSFCQKQKLASKTSEVKLSSLKEFSPIYAGFFVATMAK